MNRAEIVTELDYLISMVNATSAIFNFSDEEALSEIHHYLGEMNTIAQPQTIVLLCIYIPVFLLSLTGNSVVIFVVVKNKHMRRIRNIFLVNLACADLAVTLICMPLVAGTTVYRMWLYGDFLCKSFGYLQGVAVTGSIWTLVALSLDRCMAIKSPLNKHRLRNSRQALQVVAIIWIISALLISPLLFVRKIVYLEFERFHINVSYCIESWTKRQYVKTFAVVLFMCLYAVPIVAIALSYSIIGKALCVGSTLHRKSSESSSTVMLSRKRVARMLIALIGIFFVCWLPYNICSFSLDIQMDLLDTKILPFTLAVAHIHSAINPLLYWFLNKSFRNSMKGALRCEYIKAIREAPCPQFQEEVFEVSQNHPRHWILHRMHSSSPYRGHYLTTKEANRNGRLDTHEGNNVRRPFLSNNNVATRDPETKGSKPPSPSNRLSDNRGGQRQALLGVGADSGLMSKPRKDIRPIYRYQAKGAGNIKRVNSTVKADIHNRQLPAVEELEEL